MSQVNVNQPEPRPPRDESVGTRDESAGAAATRNLTWAIAAVIVIAALAIALVYVVHSMGAF